MQSGFHMKLVAAALAGALFFSGFASPAGAQEARKKVSCDSIMALCMKRAGDGHAGICEDMLSQARNTGRWPATQEPDGKKHPPVPCTP